MPYALYIDESGNFDDVGPSTKRVSLIGGWIARSNTDNTQLRKALIDWNKIIDHSKFHATEWRQKKPKLASALISSIFSLVSAHNAYAVVAIENRLSVTTQDDRMTYLDMLVELILECLVSLERDGLSASAFPLQIYIAERRGQQLSEIDYILRHRLRALLVDSANKELLTSYTLHKRYLNYPANRLFNRNNNDRTSKALMPELICADFICNELFQRNSIRNVPKGLSTQRWIPMVFQADPFWRDIQLYKRSGLWHKLAIELSSDYALEWIQSHRKMHNDFTVIYVDAITNCLSRRPEILLNLIRSQLVEAQCWEHASRLLTRIDEEIGQLPEHLQPQILWAITLLRWDIANHTGDPNKATLEFAKFKQLLKNESFQRAEFIRDVPDYYNRHAVSLTDRYEFLQAEIILKEAITIEESFLATTINSGGLQIRPRFSDVLGKLQSSLGQLYVKMGVREPSRIDRALSLFDSAERQMQRSYDQSRQRNYRVEALLTYNCNCSSIDKVYTILSESLPKSSPENIMMHNAPDSFDMLYWLRWMAESNEENSKAYKNVVVAKSNSFLSLDFDRYPQMSIAYWIGRVAKSIGENEIADQFWKKALGTEDLSNVALDVIVILRTRALCQLMLNNGDARQRYLPVLLSIFAERPDTLPGLKNYFSYAFCLRNEDVTPELLKSIIKDIPYC